VGVFQYPGTAKVVQGVLDSAGTPNFQPDQHVLDIDPFLTPVLNGRRVLVPTAYFDQARANLVPMIADADKPAD